LARPRGTPRTPAPGSPTGQACRAGRLARRRLIGSVRQCHGYRRAQDTATRPMTPIAGHDGEDERREPRPGRSGCHGGPGSIFRSSPRLRSGPLMTGTPAAASRACSAGTSHTWVQIITECPGGRPCARRPRAFPGRGRTPRRDCPEGRIPCRWPGAVRRGRSGGCGPSRWAAGGSGCSECARDYFSSTLTDGNSRRTRAIPPNCVRDRSLPPLG
jgi:hypothetical protein